MARATRASRFVLPDVDGVTDGMFDMARISPIDDRPAATGDLELDAIVGLQGLESRDVQPAQPGFTLSTPAGSVPLGLNLGPEGNRIVERCIETNEARKAWLRMLRCVGADPARPPAWATTVSTIAADLWRASGRRLSELHMHAWTRALLDEDPSRRDDGDHERRMRMISEYHQLPVTVPGHEAIAFSGRLGGSRLRLRIVTDRWVIVDSAWTMLQIDDVELPPDTVLASRIGRPLGETVAPGSIPVLAGSDPALLDIRHHDGGLYCLFGSDAVPMAKAPRAALEAVGLDESLPADVCPWFEAGRRGVTRTK
ncbi:hypothetical protein HZF05_16335 [Sphingomonas sp. CGMCC 1.13654]|uniref:Uncharacterized protein n=1 Tax=Sphingomonas chungangi TaxID=2683589 RepID=A0A838L852_9SPHN|nr:hypothetical protein [Sphingomonas chungangi]MBA2935653.1 hypothetical protein [Sphingomonas chungangi]MVW54344.1 hypothetical protein [Sphingomonas chungangi]